MSDKRHNVRRDFGKFKGRFIKTNVRNQYSKIIKMNEEKKAGHAASKHLLQVSLKNLSLFIVYFSILSIIIFLVRDFTTKMLFL